MKRTKFLNKKIKNVKDYYIGSYVKVSRKQYKKIRKLTGMGMFHMSEAIDYFVIKMINKKIRKATKKVMENENKKEKSYNGINKRRPSRPRPI